MKLSNDLVSQFVKITNDDSRKTPNTTSYGKIVTYEDTQYVQLDGSDLLTPFDKTVQVKDDERVIVTIKGHGAVITGNITDPSASTDDLINVSNDLVAFKIDTEGMFFEVHNSIGNLNTKIEVTAGAIRTELSDTAKGLENKIEITAEGIRTELTDTENELSNKIEVTAGAIRTELTDAANSLTNKIEITAGAIRTELADEVSGLNNKIEVTASSIRTELTDSHNQLSNSIEVTAGAIRTELADEVNGLNNTITTTASGINAKITNINSSISTMEGDISDLSTEISVTAGELRTEISGKVDSSEVGTIVTQNAESWGLSINGKLYGTNYTFDGSGFTIGNTNTTSSAKHTTTYSRWNHQDGSYTQVGTSGIYRYISGSGRYYHCLQYTGEYISESEDQVQITLPSEFQGKNFQVVTAVKRIYVALLDYISNARFPLLSFYAEARNINKTNGTFEIYASVRAWNRTSYGGWGTVIGNNTTDGETAAVKPVVAYWVYA